MSNAEKNRVLVLKFFQKISGKEKNKPLLEAFIEDNQLIDTLLLLETNFPGYQILLDEVTAEWNRVVIQGRTRGSSEAKIGKAPAEIPFAIGCRIERGKIVDHWFIADRLAILNQT